MNCIGNVRYAHSERIVVSTAAKLALSESAAECLAGGELSDFLALAC